MKVLDFRWSRPIGVGLALVLLAFGAKVLWESQRQLDFVERHSVGDDGVLVPELTFAATQHLPVGPAAAATKRLVDLSASDEEARRGVAMASSGARSLARPYAKEVSDAQASAHIKRGEGLAKTPSLVWRLLALLFLLGWWGGVGVWIWRGHAPDGEVRPEWRWSAPVSLSCFLGWCLSVYFI